MENAQLIGLTRQTTLRRQLDVVANNMANINTAGYKSQDMRFEEYLMPVADATAFQRPDQTLSYVHDYGTYMNTDAGAIRKTGNELDVAINGDGWFPIGMEDGTEAYTRDGSFHLNSNGTLVTANGRPVLTDSGPMTFTTDDGQISIAGDGTISTEQGQRGKIRVVNFDNPQRALRIGDNLMRYDNPTPIERPQLVQGAQEDSNVVGVKEISKLIDINRAYSSVSQMMKDFDDLRSTAIQQLGQLQS